MIHDTTRVEWVTFYLRD